MITSVPFSVDADTTGHTNEHGFENDVCPGSTGKKGNGSPDLVYAYTTATGGTYRAKLVPKATFDASLYVATSCTITKDTCLGASDELTIVPQDLGTETVDVTLTAGETIYIFADGWANTTGVKSAEGAYTLSLEQL